MNKYLTCASVLTAFSVTTALALEIEDAPDELKKYVDCVYELRGVDVEAERYKNIRDTKKIVSQMIGEAFAACKREEIQLREFGMRQGLSDAQINNRVAETNEQIAIAIRLTLARELTKAASGMQAE